MNQHTIDTRAEQNRAIEETISSIDRKLLVMSGKGGVGKSSIAVNLAVGLAGKGYHTGLMDVDLHGPSIPQMLGMPREAVAYDGTRILPWRYDERLSVVSIECMLESPDAPVIWRGPMKIGAIRQFFADVAWGKLDFLIIDSPPGTGDEPLTVAQTASGAEAIIVTTPQQVSLRDVRKSINFCRKVNLPITGLIENMSGFFCPECGKRIDLFSTGGGERAAREMEVALLGRIPVIPGIVEAGDCGEPALSTSPVVREFFDPIFECIEHCVMPNVAQPI